MIWTIWDYRRRPESSNTVRNQRPKFVLKLPWASRTIGQRGIPTSNHPSHRTQSEYRRDWNWPPWLDRSGRAALWEIFLPKMDYPKRLSRRQSKDANLSQHPKRAQFRHNPQKPKGWNLGCSWGRIQNLYVQSSFWQQCPNFTIIGEGNCIATARIPAQDSILWLSYRLRLTQGDHRHWTKQCLKCLLHGLQMCV